VTRARPDQTVPVTLRTLECGHLLSFTISPPRVGDTILCPACCIDAPPRQVVKAERASHER
jgi:hypothetical protein